MNDILNHEATKDTKVHEEKRRKIMVSMGNTLMKHSTMADRESKAFAGGPGGQFSRKEPPWQKKGIILWML